MMKREACEDQRWTIIMCRYEKDIEEIQVCWAFCFFLSFWQFVPAIKKEKNRLGLAFALPMHTTDSVVGYVS